MHLPIFQDILLLLGFSAVIVFVLQRLKLPSIIGFLITGVVIGPFGLSLVDAVEEVEGLSEIGVILLLFVIGMELSLKHLSSIRKTVFFGGLIQVGLTVLVTALFYKYVGFAWNEAVFTGFLFSLSSTAIVLKSLQDRNEIATPHGRNALGILIFQDIIVVPMMLLTPILAGQSDNPMESILMLLLKIAAVMLFAIISIKYIVPRLMHAIAKTNSKELFLLVTITICFAVAFITAEAGLSLALGAFLAGLIISESEYSHQATSLILPFRELFTSFFFVSVGMLLDLRFLINNLAVVSLVVLAVFILKTLIASIAVWVLRYPARTIILTGLSIFQIGEFAFILSRVGIEYGLLSDETNQYFLSISIISMILTPFIIMSSESMAIKIQGLLGNGQPGIKILPQEFKKIEKEDELSNHLVIIGYGVNGKNLAKAARFSNIPFLVIELEAETVKTCRQKGIPLVYGDATEPHILETANVSKARAVVVAISDNYATKIIIGHIRSISKSVYLLVRTRYVKEISELIALGADEVIPEEFETSIEIFSRVLNNFLVPEDDIENFIEKIRSDNYELFKNDKKRPKSFHSANFPDFNIMCIRINKDSGKLLGKRIGDLDLQGNHKLNLLAISRRGQIIQKLNEDDKLLRGDSLFVYGQPVDIEKFFRLVN